MKDSPSPTTISKSGGDMPKRFAKAETATITTASPTSERASSTKRIVARCLFATSAQRWPRGSKTRLRSSGTWRRNGAAPTTPQVV